jgi:hypothetical protein
MKPFIVAPLALTFCLSSCFPGPSGNQNARNIEVEIQVDSQVVRSVAMLEALGVQAEVLSGGEFRDIEVVEARQVSFKLDILGGVLTSSTHNQNQWAELTKALSHQALADKELMLVVKSDVPELEQAINTKIETAETQSSLEVIPAGINTSLTEVELILKEG